MTWMQLDRAGENEVENKKNLLGYETMTDIKTKEFNKRVKHRNTISRTLFAEQNLDPNRRTGKLIYKSWHSKNVTVEEIIIFNSKFVVIFRL